MTDAEETELVVFESRRLGRRGWEVSAIQATANSFQTDLVIQAYCDEDARRAKQVSATAAVPPDETRRLTARCPRGRKATAGGFSVPTDRDLDQGGFPLESRRAGKRSWRLAAFAPTPDGALLTTYAYCSKRVGRLRQRSASTPIGGTGHHHSTSSRKCPKRIGARSGGFSIGDQTDALFSIPLSILEGRRWRVVARNLGGDPTKLRSFAYCS